MILNVAIIILDSVSEIGFWSHFLDPPEADNDHFHNPENLRWITKSIISFDEKKKCIIKNFLQMRIIWSVKNAFLTVFFLYYLNIFSISKALE